jgi:hypothetical protein
MRIVIDEQFAHAVLIDGERFAPTERGVIWTATDKTDAQTFAKELATHITGKCRAVRVRVKIELAPTT